MSTGTTNRAQSTSAPTRPAKPAAPKVASIPDELKLRDQWVVWKYELRGRNYTKIPYQPQNPGAKAKADIPSTWSPFALAWQVYQQGGFDGIGYEFSAHDPHFGLDVDDCLDGGGVVQAWALSHVHEMSASYGEISPSGKGLKFIARGKLPSPKGTRKEALGPSGTGALELYDHGRYFALTGDVFAGSTTIADLPAAAVSLYRFAKPKAAKQPMSGGNGQQVPRSGSPKFTASDQDVFKALGRSKSAPKIRSLWAARWQGMYGSWSSADQALCNYLAFYCGPGNEAQVERLFLRSKLGQRPKATRRTDYVRRTVDSAYSGRTDFYRWNRQDLVFSNYAVTGKVIRKKGKQDEIRAALRIEEITSRLDVLAPGWPKRVEDTLFVQDPDLQPIYLDSAHRLFAWVDSFAKVDWGRGDTFVTQERFYQHLRMTAGQYRAIETLPHWPAIPGVFYMHPEIPPAGGALDSLVKCFSPVDRLDGELIKALALTLFWGGEPGARPAFLITGPDGDSEQGRGVGKSKLVDILAEELVGGYVDVSPTDSIADVKTRLLTSEAGRKRVIRLDNVKTLKFSWADLEGLITSSEISGKALYRGEGRRPNTLIWAITLNGATLSKDMAQRVIQIKLSRPTFKASWESDVRQYIRAYREGLLGDIRDLLLADSYLTAPKSRWAAWERDVLGKVREWRTLQDVVADRQATVDDDDEERSHVEEFFAEQLTRRGHVPELEMVFIPSVIAAEWLSAATRTTYATNKASAFLKSLEIACLRKSNRGDARGWVWTGKKTQDKQARKLGDPPAWDLRVGGGRASTY
jgi:hypothetical protein